MLVDVGVAVIVGLAVFVGVAVVVGVDVLVGVVVVVGVNVPTPASGAAETVGLGRPLRAANTNTSAKAARIP